MIPYSRQEVTRADIDAVVNVLQSDFLTQGPMVPRFEAAVAARVEARHAVAVSSGTSALHVACLALGLGEGDWLWTSPITFVASANCGLYCGARVDFVDIDPRTYNISPEALADRLKWAERKRRLPKVIVAVHLAGQPCAMEAIHELARRYRVRVIEDAAHAIGSAYRGEPVGNCRYSDITVFSFHPVKVITTGEGGVATSNDAALAEGMRLLRSHGVSRDPVQLSRTADGPWYYEQVELGYNYRMTDLQAALGLSQLARLDAYVERRRAIARRYDELLAGLPLVTPWESPDSRSAFHLYVIRLRLGPDDAGAHARTFGALRAAGIGVNLHYIPVYRHPYYQARGFSGDHCPEAERYYAEAISLPVFPALSEGEQRHVVDVLRQELMHPRR